MAIRYLLVLALVPLALASVTQNVTELNRLFQKFELDFGKRYRNAEERSLRFINFVHNYQEMERHNKAGHSWKKAINQFSDMSEEEFTKTVLTGYTNLAMPGNGGAKKRTHDINVKALPTEIDWREKGAVTEVKDQGSCGSCWAFAALHQIESYAQINGGSLTDLSAQQITSCTPNPLKCGGTGGCMGSIPQLAYSYVQLFGLVSEKDWGYSSGDWGSTGDCDFDPTKTKPAVTLRGFESLPKNDQDAVLEHLATKGPLAVAVAASPWFSYGGGVFDGCSFSSNIELNHAVQLVGFGTDPQDGDYWILRNSWGPWWGENGYIKLKKTDNVECGTNSSPLSGVACVGDGVDEQHVCGQCGILFDTNYPIGVEEIKN